MIKHFLLLAFLFSSFNMYAQDLSGAAQKTMKRGKNYMELGSYQDALDEFLSIGPSINSDLNYNIGVVYIKLRKPDLAISYLMQAKLYKTEYQEVDLYLGQAFHLKHDFTTALDYFNTYKKNLRDGQRTKLAEVDTYITYCNNGLFLSRNPIEVEIKNLGTPLNSTFPEYNPVLSVDESFIAFTSRRPDSRGKKLDPSDLMYYEDIYVSNKDSTGKWSTPVSIGNKINTDYHDACIGLSADGQQMIIYSSVSGGGDIFISTLDGTEWTTPKDPGKNINSKYWESSATISSDHSVILFSSNRPGGSGGTDIYYSRKDSTGVFGPAVRLGPQVNTPGDEIAPFIHADGQTLYFSSNSSNLSMGGFDIMSVKIDLETGELLSSAENIGIPINTADDDFNFVWSADNTRAYFSSIREKGLGTKDIYMLERNVALSPLIVWSGLVHDCLTDVPVTAKITVSDNESKKTIGVYTPNKSTGKYTIILPAGTNYNIVVEAPFYAFFSKNINIPNLDSYQEIEEKICLEPIIKGTTINLRNIFFDFNKALLRSESELELERLVRFMGEYPEISVEISGHTDSEGDDEYNMKLSLKRAEAVYDYLIRKGISKDRLIPKGYGKTQPLATNETEEGRQINRRTAVTIIK
jgi:outer membrane protein OmpA-like peptidoglycan-associated protein/Tol biopolymer transport system component